MARERRPPSARSRDAAGKTQEKNAAETHNHNEHPATQKDVNSYAAASSASDGSLKHDENQQSSSSEVTDTRTFQQLVHDYGADMLSLNELFHAQPSDSNVELNPETDEGK